MADNKQIEPKVYFMDGRSFLISQADADQIAEALRNRETASVNFIATKFLTANCRAIAFVERASLAEDVLPTDAMQDKICFMDGRSFPVSDEDADEITRNLQSQEASVDFTTGDKLITANCAAIAFVERASLPEGDFDEEPVDDIGNEEEL